MITGLLYALFGLLVGAFLNLLADQLAQWRRLQRKPFCPYCQRSRPWWAWMSVLAWLRLKAECEHCGAPISMRHPLVELGTAVLYAWLSQRFGPTTSLLLYSSYSAVLILAAVIDLEHRVVPNAVIYPAWAVALLGSIIDPVPGALSSALGGGAIGFGLLLLIHLAGRFFTMLVHRFRHEPVTEVAFGLGDVRLGGFIGLVVGFPQVLIAILLAVLLGGLAVLLYWLVQACLLRRYSPFTALPYAPFLAAGAMITLFCQPEIPQGLLRA